MQAITKENILAQSEDILKGSHDPIYHYWWLMPSFKGAKLCIMDLNTGVARRYTVTAENVNSVMQNGNFRSMATKYETAESRNYILGGRIQITWKGDEGEIALANETPKYPKGDVAFMYQGDWLKPIPKRDFKYKTVGSFGDSTFPVEIHLDPNHLFGYLGKI